MTRGARLIPPQDCPDPGPSAIRVCRLPRPDRYPSAGQGAALDQTVRVRPARLDAAPLISCVSLWMKPVLSSSPKVSVSPLRPRMSSSTSRTSSGRNAPEPRTHTSACREPTPNCSYPPSRHPDGKARAKSRPTRLGFPLSARCPSATISPREAPQEEAVTNGSGPGTGRTEVAKPRRRSAV